MDAGAGFEPTLATEKVAGLPLPYPAVLRGAAAAGTDPAHRQRTMYYE